MPVGKVEKSKPQKVKSRSAGVGESDLCCVGPRNFALGAAIRLSSSEEVIAEVKLSNSTIYANTVQFHDFRGASAVAGRQVTMRNCIAYENVPSDWQIHSIEPEDNDIEHCIVHGDATNEGFAHVLAQPGNIQADPMFESEDPNDPGYLRLLAISPAIDAGTSLVDTDPTTPGFQLLPLTDLDGNPRTVAGSEGGAAIVDMGAYEFQSAGDGACCLNGGTCVPGQTAGYCVDDLAGTFEGAGTVCDPNPCN